MLINFPKIRDSLFYLKAPLFCLTPVGEAVEWLSNKAKESNVSYASITDGLIYLGGEIVGEMVIVSEDIIDHLWDHAGED